MMSDLIRVSNTPQNTDTVHLVVGHSQILDCWKFVYEKEELNFPINWICKRGNTSPSDFMEIIKDELKKSQVPLRILAIIWLNAIPDLSLDHVKKIINEAEEIMIAHPEHRIAFPEILFIPHFKAFSDKTARINSLLAEFNFKKGYDKYPLYKVGIKAKWEREFYLKEKDKKSFTSFIRKFHLNNFFSPVQENFSLIVENHSPKDNRNWLRNRRRD